MEALQRLVPQGLPVSLQVIAVTLFLGFLYSYITKDRPFAGFPVIALDGKSPKETWTWNGRKVAEEGVRRFSGPFQVMTGSGPKIILPNRFADEIRNNPALDFNRNFIKEFPLSYPGFEPFKQGLDPTKENIIPDVTRMKLTQSLGLVTGDLVDETAESSRDILGEPKEWKTINLTDTMADIITRLSSRVFLGKELCRNERWLEIAKTHTIDIFTTAMIMQATPAFMRPITYLLLPHSRRIRNALGDTRKLIGPEIERRKAAVDAALAAGEKPPKVADTLGWMYELTKSRNVDYDYSCGQLSLTMAAIHTTTQTMSQALLDICEHPEVVEPLRKEIVEVLSESGWHKTSLYKLKLMDSFLKEGQRIRPMSSGSMGRYVMEEVTLSDGTVLPKGSRIMVVGKNMDPTVFPEPERFDAARFLRLREQPGQEHSWQFVTTSPDHMLFGHGQHACPGRFFASNELKIALCYFLLNYDWRFVPGESVPQAKSFEWSLTYDASTKVQFKRRSPEIDLDSL